MPQLKQLYKGFFFFPPLREPNWVLSPEICWIRLTPPQRKKKKREKGEEKKCYVAHVGILWKVSGKRGPQNPWRQERVVRKGCTWRTYISLQWLVDSGDERTLHDTSRRLLLKQPWRLLLCTKKVWRSHVGKALFSLMIFSFFWGYYDRKGNLLLIRIHEGNYSALI